MSIWQVLAGAAEGVDKGVQDRRVAALEKLKYAIDAGDANAVASNAPNAGMGDINFTPMIQDKDAMDKAKLAGLQANNTLTQAQTGNIGFQQNLDTQKFGEQQRQFNAGQQMDYAKFHENVRQFGLQHALEQSRLDWDKQYGGANLGMHQQEINQGWGRLNYEMQHGNQALDLERERMNMDSYSPFQGTDAQGNPHLWMLDRKHGNFFDTGVGSVPHGNQALQQLMGAGDPNQPAAGGAGGQPVPWYQGMLDTVWPTQSGGAPAASPSTPANNGPAARSIPGAASSTIYGPGHPLPQPSPQLYQSHAADFQGAFGQGTVTSVYRTPEHNREVGGSPTSYHLLGEAIDTTPPLTRVGDAINWGLSRGMHVYNEGNHIHFEPAPGNKGYYSVKPGASGPYLSNAALHPAAQPSQPPARAPGGTNRANTLLDKYAPSGPRRPGPLASPDAQPLP